MSKKITKFICFLVTAVMLCSCSAKGGDDGKRKEPCKIRRKNRSSR